MKLNTPFAIFAALILLPSCSTTTTPIYSHFDVTVSSFAREGIEAENLTSFVLFPADENVSSDDLEFLEYSKYVVRALEEQGFSKAESLLSADIGILLLYGIGDPQTRSYSYSIPTYGQTGVSSSNTTGSYNAATGTFSQNTTYTPSYGATGSQTVSGSRTTFGRYARLKAFDLNAYREQEVERVVWETRIVSIGRSSDLRRVFPIMVGASIEYIGTNTGKAIHRRMTEGAKDVKLVKGLID